MRRGLPLKFLVPLPVAAVVALAGLGVCRIASIAPSYTDLLIAAGVTIFASELAMVPLDFVRGKTAETVAQAALVATAIHLLVSAAGAMGIMQWMRPHGPFIYWLCAFYWSALATVCTIGVRAIKSAPIPVNSLMQGSEA